MPRTQSAETVEMSGGSCDDPQLVDALKPFVELVPTRENAAHHSPQNSLELPLWLSKTSYMLVPLNLRTEAGRLWSRRRPY